MPRILTSAMKREYNQVASTHSLAWLFELQIPNAPIAYRVANFPEDVLFHGLIFIHSGIDVDALEDASSQSLVHLRCSIENVSQEVQSLLENYWGPDSLWITTIWRVDVTQPDEVGINDGWVYAVGQVSTIWTTATLDLYAESLTLTSTLPKRRYTTLGGFSSLPRRIGF